MARLDRTKRIDPRLADNHAEVGRRLLHAGRAIVEHGDERHASALAILSVHVAISFADAVAIHSSGRKSTSSDHEASVRLLRAALGARLSTATENALRRLIGAKDRFEYQGYVATMREAAVLFGHAERIATWADGVLTSFRRSDS